MEDAMRDKVQAGGDATPEEHGDADVPGVRRAQQELHPVRHAWLGEAVPLCASESLRQRTIELKYVKYASQANCLFCMALIR